MPRPVRPIPPLATRKKGRKKAGAALLTAAIAMAPPSPAEATMEEVFTPGFEDYLKDVEGYGAGYDKKTKKYYPYSDVKGHLTIGVGHKILDDELQALSKGLTDEEVNTLMRKDVEIHMDRAHTYVDSHFGRGAWKRLEPIQKQMLTDYSYNPGLGKFPKFTHAVVNEDWERAYAEMRRYAVVRDDTGEMTNVVPLVRRNKAFYDNFLGPLRSEQALEREEMARIIAARGLEM